MVAKAIVEAYLKTMDAASTAKLMHAMLRQPKAESEGVEVDMRNQAAELTGPIIQGIYTLAPK